MKIGFIGYGNMARALSKRWASKYDVFIGGRNPEKATELAKEVHAAGSGSASDAVQFGDIIVIATPASAVDEAIHGAGGAQAFSGKIVIDINNPVSVPDGPHETKGEHYLPIGFKEGSLAEHIAAIIPNAQIVKAFNMCHASVWEMNPPSFDGRKLVALYCGDHPEAKSKVSKLIECLGCDAVDVGELKYSRLLEASACLVIKFLFAGRDLRTVLNLIQPEVKAI